MRVVGLGPQANMLDTSGSHWHRFILHYRPQKIHPLSAETTDPTDEPIDSLADLVIEHGLDLSAEEIDRLDEYRELLWGWNEKLNLTRHTTLEKYVTRDLVDTLQLSEQLAEGERVLDIGSGGGVPGLPLAIIRPDLEVSVCESVAKKANVLQAMVEELGLPVKVYAARVEQVLESVSFDSLIARAVAPLWKFLFWLKPHRQAFRKLVLIKGPAWVEERGEARHRGLMKGFALRRIGDYMTPRTDATSTLLLVTAEQKRPPKKQVKRPKKR